MKASMGMLRRLTSHKVDAKEKGELVATAQIEELDLAGKVISHRFSFVIDAIYGGDFSRVLCCVGS